MTANPATAKETDFANAVVDHLELPAQQVIAAVRLLSDGNTIPFIARYRKEATNGLDELELRRIEDVFEKMQALAARRIAVKKSIADQDGLTAQLENQIDQCRDIQSLENLYLPYKPKRRSRATIAREKRLQPLADALTAQDKLKQSKLATLEQYVDSSAGVEDTEAALAGALDIVAEQWSEDPAIRRWLTDLAMSKGMVASKLKRGKKEQAGNFELYLDHQEAAARIPSHRLLAMQRGASEGILRVSLKLDDAHVLEELKRRLIENRQFEFCAELIQCAEDCYERLLLPAVESACMQSLKERADEEAIDVFAKNLQELLLAAPAGPKATIGLDPGFRSGCKVAVVDATGQYLANATVYPVEPKNDVASATKVLLDMVSKYSVELIAIGNGTASRETESFVDTLIRKHKLSVTKVMVSEAGASIYSASDVAIKEFPDLDITVRGAISIARRLQDPLAELVKSDPKSIGVGQYQHDVNQPRLRKSLDRVVESCVNTVGVDLNTASDSLLSHVAGIGPKLASNIVIYRNENGQFSSRKQLNKVPKLGKKAFQQSAGFLRIRDGEQPLDNCAVHPESYAVVTRMASTLGTRPNALVGNAALSGQLNPKDYVDDTFGLPTINDIIVELAKPGRDPRKQFRVVKFDEQINAIEDLREGMKLEGVITNVTNFGAFIDIGVHQDALIHISQLADKFVKDPNEIVSVGDIVSVRVLEIDIERKRIAVSRKGI